MSGHYRAWLPSFDAGPLPGHPVTFYDWADMLRWIRLRRQAGLLIPWHVELVKK